MLALSAVSHRSALRPLQAPGLSPDSLLRYDDLIVAPATANGPGARAILRLTGENAWTAVRSLLHPKEDIPASITPGRFPVQLRLPDFYSPLPVQVQAWAAPFTYTGQDLVELHLISSPPLVQALLDHLIHLGARLADRGEFTLRAYLASKLDLTQAEAVLTLSSSQDSQELRTALAQLAGGLARPLDALREELLLLLAEVEAGLDFAEEDLSFIDPNDLAWRIDACHAALLDVHDQMKRQGRSASYYRVVLAGLPNAGKSSLFNALLGNEHALVSAQPGTTRDYLTQTMQVQGVSLQLVDTAGEESPLTDIEQQAQELRSQQLTQADSIIYCFDASQGLLESERLWIQAQPEQKIVLCATKSDLPASAAVPGQAIQTSTKTGAGIATLRFSLAEAARRHLQPKALSPSLTRCQHHVEQAIKSLKQAVELVHERRHMEIVAAELRLALDEIGKMIGAVYTDDLLDRVFSQFCIGK